MAAFKWNDRYHGNVAESFWIWIEDPETNHIYHHEHFTLQKKQVIYDLQPTSPLTSPSLCPDIPIS